MSHVRRLGVGAVLLLAVLILGVFIDSAFYPIRDVARDLGADSGPFGAVITQASGAATVVVPMMLLGITLWIIYGSIQEERAEEQRRRVR